MKAARVKSQSAVSLDALRRVGVFSELSSGELNALCRYLKGHTYKKGEVIFVQGHVCRQILFVHSGSVKVFRISSAGREQIIEILHGGQTCACHLGTCDWQCTASLKALTPCKVWFMSTADFYFLNRKYPNITLALSHLFASRVRHLSFLLEEVALKGTLQRLVRFLLGISKSGCSENGQNEPLPCLFTREEIAHQLGTTRETVTRHLSRLARSKFIAIDSRRIILRDKPALEALLN